MPDNIVVTFRSPDEFFRALRPPQHDAHVHAFRCRRNLDRLGAQNDAFRDACAEILAEEREAQAQRVAKDYDYNTASIRAALHRWTSGCFSPPNIALAAASPDYRAARIRQLTRALDISIERHGSAAVAAE